MSHRAKKRARGLYRAAIPGRIAGAPLNLPAAVLLRTESASSSQIENVTAGATRRMTVPVSAELLTDTASYFQALTAYRDGDPVPVVGRFAEDVITALDDFAARLGRRA